MRGDKPALIVMEGGKQSRRQAPAWLTADAKAEWRRVEPILRQRRILTDADLGSLENYCLATGQVRECARVIDAEGLTVKSETSAPRPHPAIRIQHAAMTLARLLAAELGLTPVSRSRPAMLKDDQADAWTDMD